MTIEEALEEIEILKEELQAERLRSQQLTASIKAMARELKHEN